MNIIRTLSQHFSNVCLRRKVVWRTSRVCCLLGNKGVVRLSCYDSNSNCDLNGKDNICSNSKMPGENDSKLTFRPQANPVTGKMEWVAEDREDYDYIQEIARSGYGDMLHDVDRNVKYYAAIQQAIRLMRQQGKEVKVLDIGTGTGLLSMMAAASGADSITACEAFTPMAVCAQKVLRTNNFSDKIKLVPKRSTEVLLDEDLKEKANLLVTELFDTELIGEGAIPSYTDAHDRLMEDDCIAVPTLGIMYVQAVQCPLLRHWNSLHQVELPNGTAIAMPPQFGQCTGAPSLHDLQVDQLEDQLVLLSDPVEVFRFDFSKKKALKKDEKSLKTVQALADGVVDAFVMWWDLEMEPLGEIILSCAPCWTRTPGETIPWRDHWMQAVYYPSSPLTVSKNGSFDIHSYHDEYSLWFDAVHQESCRPVCTCGLHVTMSRNRLAQMNCPQRNHIFVSALQKHLDQSKTCLVISDGSMLPLIAARLGAKKVFCIDNNPATQKVLRQIIKHNGLEDQIVFLQGDAERLSSKDFQGLQIDVVIAEPYFQGVYLPWQHLYFWYAASSLRACLAPDVVILPGAMTIKCMAVEFTDLHKIRAPVGICEGFDISHFDDLIEKSSKDVDEDLEPQPLWEYPCRSLSESQVLMTLDFTHPSETAKAVTEKIELNCTKEGNLNGIAVWTEFEFSPDLTLNCGLDESKGSKDILSWDKTSKQGVHLFRHSRKWQNGDNLSLDITFNPANGDFNFTLL